MECAECQLAAVRAAARVEQAEKNIERIEGDIKTVNQTIEKLRGELRDALKESDKILQRGIGALMLLQVVIAALGALQFLYR